MAKTSVTGLVLRDTLLEWTLLSPEKAEPVASCRLPLAIRSAATAGADDDLQNDEHTVDVVQQLQIACHGISGDVVLGVPLSSALVRVLELPIVEDEELGSLVALQIEKLAPFALDRAVYGHEIVAIGENTCRVLVAVLRERDVLAIGDQLAHAHVRVDHVDIDTLGICRDLQEAGRIAASGTHVCFVCSAGRLDFCVYRGGCIEILRTVGQITVLSPRALAMEIARSLMSLDIERGADAIVRIDFVHDDGDVGDFPALLARELGVEIDVHNTLPGAGSRGVAARRQDAAVQALDLRPAAWKARETAAVFRRRSLKISGLVICGWLLLLATAELVVWRARAARRALTDKIEAIADAADEVRLNIRLIKDLNRYAEKDQSALEALLFIADLMPARGVELNLFTYQKGRSVKIGGDAVQAELIYEMKKNIDESTFFESSVLAPIRVFRGTQRFEIEMFFRQEESE